MKYIGAHLPISTGFNSVIDQACIIGANSYAIFTKPPTTWRGKVIAESAADRFKAYSRKHWLPPEAVLVHASYMINMGSPDEAKAINAKNAFVDELQRCKALGLTMLNFHPGSYLNGDKAKAVDQIGMLVKESIDEVDGVAPVIETMAGQGTNLGADLGDIARMLELIDDDEAGVCVDTCHSFAAGYDIRTEDGYSKFMDDFDKIIGLKRLRGFHLNDSKCPLGSRKDRHEQLGRGHIGIDAFKLIVQDSRTDNIPLILETPNPGEWKAEIALLKSFSK